MCHRNETLYKVLKLENVIDLNSLRDYAERYNINDTIKKLRAKINLDPGVVILSQSARRKLKDLAESGLDDINFNPFTELMEYNITNTNLEQLANKLKNVIPKLPRDQDSVREQLKNCTDDLDNLHINLVSPMIKLSEKLSDNAKKLQEHIKFNHSSMAEAVQNLVKEVTAVEQFLNKKGPEYVQKVRSVTLFPIFQSQLSFAIQKYHLFLSISRYKFFLFYVSQLSKKFGEAFLHQVDKFMNFVTKSGTETVGKCGPVSNAYKATLVATCNKILDPFVSMICVFF